MSRKSATLVAEICVLRIPMWGYEQGSDAAEIAKLKVTNPHVGL